MRHTRTGWWLEEAGEVTPTRPLDGDARADVVVVGGGYLGLWTAWQLRELEPELDVLVLEAAVCGHGPSGRNGGFCETLWGDAPTLRDHAGDAAALAVCRASEYAVRGIGAWCEANAVDAWFREAPMLQVATTDSQAGSWDVVVDAAAALGEPDAGLVSLGRRGASALRLAPLPRRRAVPPERDRASGSPRARPPRKAPRARRADPRAHRGDPPRARRERRDPSRSGGRERRRPRRQLRRRVLPRLPAARSRSRPPTSSSPSRFRTCSTSSAGRAARRSSTAAPSSTTCGRRATAVSSFGWGGGAMGLGGRASDRLELDRDVVVETERALRRFFPQTRGRDVTHAWGGPIDVSPTHLPIFGSRGRVHHGFGFTGNGVGPSYLGGEILARLALDRRDERTALAIVEPPRKLFPPEPFRYAGGSLIRRALVAKDAAEDDGREPSAPTRARRRRSRAGSASASHASAERVPARQGEEPRSNSCTHERELRQALGTPLPRPQRRAPLGGRRRPRRVRPRQSPAAAAARDLTARPRRPRADERAALARPPRARAVRSHLPGRNGTTPSAPLLGLEGSDRRPRADAGDPS